MAHRRRSTRLPTSTEAEHGSPAAKNKCYITEMHTSDFVRDAIRDKLAAIKTIKYRDVDYETAKKEVMGYFRERGEAYPSEIEEDLELDYRLICQIVDELKREGRLEVL